MQVCDLCGESAAELHAIPRTDGNVVCEVCPACMPHKSVADMSLAEIAEEADGADFENSDYDRHNELISELHRRAKQLNPGEKRDGFLAIVDKYRSVAYDGIDDALNGRR